MRRFQWFPLITVLAAMLLLAVACGEDASDVDGDAGAQEPETDAEDDPADVEPESGDEDPEDPEDSEEEGAGDVEPATLDLGISVPVPDADLFPYYAAEEVGYFEEEGLTINVVPTGGSGSLIEQLVAENLPLGTPNGLTLLTAMGRADLGLVNYYTMSYGTNFGIYVTADSEIQDVAELEGRIVGVSEPGGGEFSILEASLGDAGLTLEDVTTIPIGTGDAATFDAVESGRVDAFAAGGTDVFSIVVAGLEMREITPPLFVTSPQRGLITTPAFLDQNRDTLVRFGRAWAKATLFCLTNPDACADFQAQQDPETWDANEAGHSVGSLKYADAVPNFSVPEGELFGRHYVESYDELVDDLERTVEGYEPFSLEEFLNDDLLEEINDFDHEAVIAEAEEFSG